MLASLNVAENKATASGAACKYLKCPLVPAFLTTALLASATTPTSAATSPLVTSTLAHFDHQRILSQRARTPSSMTSPTWTAPSSPPLCVCRFANTGHDNSLWCGLRVYARVRVCRGSVAAGALTGLRCLSPSPHSCLLQSRPHGARSTRFRPLWTTASATFCSRWGAANLRVGSSGTA